MQLIILLEKMLLSVETYKNTFFLSEWSQVKYRNGTVDFLTHSQRLYQEIPCEAIPREVLLL